MRTRVDREHLVPLLHRGVGEPAADADADVAHQPVDPEQGVGRLPDDPRARRFVGDVAHDDRSGTAFGLHQPRGLLGREAVAIDASH